MRNQDADVTICVPAYQSEEFVADTLAAVARQTHARIRVLVSVDASSDGTEATCRAFESDLRFRVFVQPSRLGWVGNTNFLLDRVRSDFHLILPHDDQITDDYVETLRAAALGTPDAIVAYGDIQTFGLSEHVRSTPGLGGPLVARVRTLLASPTGGVPFRGLTRSRVLGRGLRMIDNTFGGFGAARLWALQLLCLGPFEHVARPLYRRWIRADPNSVVNTWGVGSREQQLAAWAEHCAACLRIVAGARGPDRERFRLVLVQTARMLGTGPGARQRARPDDPARREELVMLATQAARSLGMGELSAAELVSVRDDRELWESIATFSGS